MNNDSLKEIIKEIIVKEFMAISLGAGSMIPSGQIAGGPALPLGVPNKIPSDIASPAGRKKRKRKKRKSGLNEANSVLGMSTAAWGIDSLESLLGTIIGSKAVGEPDTETYIPDSEETNIPNEKAQKAARKSNAHKMSPNKHSLSSKNNFQKINKDAANLKTSSEKQNNFKLKNPFHKLMWDGDKPIPNILKVKYVILEENLNKSSRKNKILKDGNLYNPTATVHLDKKITEETKDALTNFLQFCQAMLGIEVFPEIYIVSERMPGMTTGAYLPSRKIVLALSENRLMIDVFRTIAHELTHCKQHERGELDNLPERKGEDDMSDVNTPYENEAYMNSGNFSKAWARLYKGMTRDEIFSATM